MISGRNIVCLASSFYDHPTSKHHIMRRLARENRVLWVNCHASRRPTLSLRDLRLAARRLLRVRRAPIADPSGIAVLSPLLAPLPRLRWARRWNGRRLRRAIAAFLRGAADAPAQLWAFTPDLPEAIDAAAFERVVYYCVDDFAAFAGFDTALIERLEARTLALSDVVFASAAALVERCARRHASVFLAPHGVDLAHFAVATDSARPAAAELDGLPRPVLLFMGLVGEHVDIEMLAAAARNRPDWSFVLAGEVRVDVSSLRGRGNVRLLGPQPYASLPALCRGADVGLIPFRMSRLVRAVNPIKLREYLAAGLPVVSAPMPEVLGYAPAVQTATSVAQFIAAVESCLRLAGREPPAARQRLVADESWDARVAWLGERVANPASRREAAAAPEPQGVRAE